MMPAPLCPSHNIAMRSPPYSRKAVAYAQGFTLIEAMVTVAILAILVGLALPDLRSSISRNRISSMTETWAGGLNLSKMEAIKRNASVRFCLDTNALNWAVELNSNGTDIRTGTWNAGPVVNTANLQTINGAQCVIYRSDGLPYAGGVLVTQGQLQATQSGETSQVDIRVGAISVSTP